jgi:hypothetical protein
MAWTAFPTWVAGQVSVASDWNTYVAGNMSFLATPPMWRVYRATAYTLAASTTTVFPYDTVSYDSASGFSTSTHLYTVPVAGTYTMTAQLNTTSSTAAHAYFLTIYHNGSEFARGFSYGADTTSPVNNGCFHNGSLVPCSAADTLNIDYFGSGDALSIAAYSNWFAGYKVSN